MEDHIEVQVDDEPNIWFVGAMVDINPKGRVTVRFEEDVWPQRDFAPSSVRRSVGAPADFSPMVGDEVEVKVGAVQGQPGGWAKGTVKQEKAGFYFVTLAAVTSGRQQDQIFEREALRPVSNASPLNPTAYEREIVQVDQELHKWVQSQDAQGCFDQVLNKSNVSHVTCDSSRATPVVVLLGDAKQTHRARLLLEVHFKHQKEIQRFHDRREEKLRQIEQKKALHALSYREEFTVDEEIVGLVIGAKGENIRKVQAEHGVDIHVDRYETSNGSSATRKVKIVGQTKESVENARAAVEYLREYFQVEESMVGWTLGKARKNLVEFQEKTGITRLRWVPERSAIELCGLRVAIEDTLTLLEAHSQYYAVYKEMGREQENINESFVELGQLGPKGGYKGSRPKGKGESWDDGKAKGKGGKDDGKALKGKGKGKEDGLKPKPSGPAPDMGSENFPDLGKEKNGKGARKGGGGKR
jgi:hypothetical protein